MSGGLRLTAGQTDADIVYKASHVYNDVRINK